MDSRIIILGIAPCLEDDLKRIFDLAGKVAWDYMAIGLDCSDRVLFDIQHMASYHKEFDLFRARRKRAGGNLDYKTHSHLTDAGVDFVWPLVDRSPYSGSSAYLGAQAAVGMNYGKVVLCGCPMQGDNLTPGKKTRYDTFQKGWAKHYDKLQGKVRAMSGFTKELLGEPTEGWLYGV